MRKLYAAIFPQPFVWPYPVRLHGHLNIQSTLSAGYLHASTNVPGSDDLNGINVKYRYEFTDTLGMVTSFQLCRETESPADPLQRYPLV